MTLNALKIQTIERNFKILKTAIIDHHYWTQNCILRTKNKSNNAGTKINHYKNKSFSITFTEFRKSIIQSRGISMRATSYLIVRVSHICFSNDISDRSLILWHAFDRTCILIFLLLVWWIDWSSWTFDNATSAHFQHTQRNFQD